MAEAAARIDAVKPRAIDPHTRLLVWWTGEAELEAEINLSFNAAAKSSGLEFSLHHIGNATSLEYHRPRAPEVALAFLAPSTSSWARARGTTHGGPPRLRSLAWPLGTPGLEERHRIQVERDNQQLALSLEIGELLRPLFIPWVFTFPEQFGSTSGEPAASAWDLSELQQWARSHKLWRLALNQCEFGGVRRRPTGLLTNIALKETRLYHGWPKLQSRQDHTMKYQGPLLKNCSCGRTHAPAQHRAKGPPWEAPQLQSFLSLILRRALHRELPSGKGPENKVAIDAADLDTIHDDCTQNDAQKLCRAKANVNIAGMDSIESDSDATVPEPASPCEDQAVHGRAQGRDLRLCRALNIFTKDRHTWLHS